MSRSQNNNTTSKDTGAAHRGSKVMTTPWHGVEPDPWHGVENYGNFSFRYCQDVTNPGKVRIYIERQPEYRGRLTNSHATHRLFSGEGAPPHICIKAIYLPGTFEQAQLLAHRWADATENYIRTGQFN